MQSMLAIGCAPAIVRADSLMRIVLPRSAIILPSVIVPARETIITVSMITREALAILEKNLTFGSYRDHRGEMMAKVYASGNLRDMDSLERRLRIHVQR